MYERNKRKVIEEYTSIQRVDINDMRHMIEMTGLSTDAANVKQMFEILLQDEAVCDGKISTQQMIECLDILYEEYTSRHRIYTVKQVLELLQQIYLGLFAEKSSTYLTDIHKFIERSRKADYLYLCDMVNSILSFREVVSRQDFEDVISRYEEQCIFNGDDIFINNQDPVEQFVCNISLFLDNIAADRPIDDIVHKARYLRDETGKVKEHISEIRRDFNDRLFGMHRKCEDLTAENASLQAEVETMVESQGQEQFLLSIANSKELRSGSQSRLTNTRDLNLMDDNLKLQDTIESLKADNKALRETVESLKADKAKLFKDSDAMHLLIEELNQRYKQLIDEQIELQEDLCTAKSKIRVIDEHDQEKIRLAQQNQALKNQAEESAQKVEYLESEVSNLLLVINQLRGNVEQPLVHSNSSVNFSSLTFEEFAEPKRELEVAIELKTYWFKIADIPHIHKRGAVLINKLQQFHRIFDKPVPKPVMLPPPLQPQVPAVTSLQAQTRHLGIQTDTVLTKPMINSIFEVDMPVPEPSQQAKSLDNKQLQTDESAPHLSTSHRVIEYTYRGMNSSLMIKTYQDMNIKLQREKEDLEQRFRQFYNKVSSKQSQDQNQSASQLEALRATIENMKKEHTKLQQEYQNYRDSMAEHSQAEIVVPRYQEKIKQQLKAAQSDAMMMSLEMETFKQSAQTAKPLAKKEDKCISTEVMIIPFISDKDLEQSLVEGANNHQQTSKKDNKQSMDQIRRRCAYPRQPA